MTAFIELNEQYEQEFQQFIQTLPREAVTLTLIENPLNEEILKRITEIKNGKIKTHALSNLTQIREKYAQH